MGSAKLGDVQRSMVRRKLRDLEPVDVKGGGAAAAFKQHGMCVFEHVLPPSLIDSCREAFAAACGATPAAGRDRCQQCAGGAAAALGAAGCRDDMLDSLCPLA